MELKPFIVGKNIDLRPLTSEDVNGDYVNWLNDVDVNANNGHHVYPYNRELALQYIAGVADQQKNLVLAVVTKDGLHIGNASLQNIDPIHRNAEFAILLGDKEYWGRGIGEEVAILLLNHGFNALNLHRIYCGTIATNVAMQKIAKKIGMREEGRRIEAFFKDGLYTDVFEYGLLKKEFQSSSV